MDFVKKEWKAIVITLCLICIVVYLSQIKSQLNALKIQNAKLISTIDSVESVTLSTDASINEMGKKVDGIDAGISFAVQKLRRR